MEKWLFSGRLRPDWGNTARAAMAGLGSIGLRYEKEGKDRGLLTIS